MIHFVEIAHAGVITEAPTFQQIGLNVLNFLLSVAGILAIIMLRLSGIFYFLAAGNEARMEKAKKSAIYSILGIIIIVSGMVMIRMINQFFEN